MVDIARDFESPLVSPLHVVVETVGGEGPLSCEFLETQIRAIFFHVLAIIEFIALHVSMHVSVWTVIGRRVSPLSGQYHLVWTVAQSARF